MQDWRKIPTRVSQGLLSFALLPRYVCALSFHGLCRFQDGRKTRACNHWQASQLPQEVLLHIFDLLRTRAKFGETVRVLDEWPPAPGTFSASNDLAAARLVCRAWHGAATEIMYADVTLISAQACVIFAAVLLARPQLAHFVQRIVFPLDSRQLSNSMLTDQRWSADVSPNIRRLDLKAAIDRVMVQCAFATDVTFFRDTAALEDVPGLMQCAERAEHLSIRLVSFADGPLQIDFPADTLQRFPRLQSLTLQRQRPHCTLHMTASTTLRSLYLGHCVLEPISFRAMLAHLPNLCSIFWRENSWHGHHTIAELFSPRHHALTDCTLIDAYRWWAELSFIDLATFASLRRLTLSAWMLNRIQATPPSLVELIITTAPQSSYIPLLTHTRRTLDLSHAILTYLLPGAPFWRDFSSPSLRAIELWDTVMLSQIPQLSVIAYILHGYLEPLGFEVSVNLFLEKSEVSRARRMLWRRHRHHRLLWRDVS